MRHGEYIALGKIEAVLKTSSAVNNVLIYGSGDILMPVAVCLPVEKVVRQWAEELNLTGTLNELCQQNEIIKKMNQALLKETFVIYMYIIAYNNLAYELFLNNRRLLKTVTYRRLKSQQRCISTEISRLDGFLKVD